MIPFDVRNDLAQLDRYLAGDCTLEERARVEQRLAQDKRFAAICDALHDGAQGTSTGTLRSKDVGADHAWARLQRSMEDAPLRQVSGPRRSGGTLHRFRHLSARVGVAVAASIVLGIMLRRMERPATSFASHVYRTPSGRRGLVTLPGGTVMTLGPATTATVMQTNAHDVRVALLGMAQFVVPHTHNDAFIVRAGHVITRVLGTNFSVRRYRGDDARIGVSDGRVSVQAVDAEQRNTHDLYVLSAGMIGIVNDSAEIRVTNDHVMSNVGEWREGQLVFRGTPLRDLLIELGRAYDADIRMPDTTFAQHPFTVTVPLNRWTVDDAVKLLADALNAHYVHSGRTLTILTGRQTPRPSLMRSSSEAHYGL